MTTLTNRTAIELEAAVAAIGGINGMIDKVDAFLQECRNMPAHEDDFVVGFPQYGRFVNRRGELTNITHCGIWSAEDRGHAMGMRVVNGHGEVAIVLPLIAALDQVIMRQEELRTQLCHGYQDTLAELVERREIDAQIEADAAACEEADALAMERAADEGEYYDQFDCWYGDDDSYDQRRDEKAERDADARQDR